MILLYSIGLFLITFIGGSIPLWSKNWTEQRMKSLLAFSGAFLLSVTLLHLVPESVSIFHYEAGILILAGFFLQQAIQKFTHGVEHGHAHRANGHHHIAILPVFIGLSVHAFSEGLPLGAAYRDTTTLPSLYLAIGLHKLPEAMLITSLVHSGKGSKKRPWLLLLLFSLITPVAGGVTHLLGTYYEEVTRIVQWCIPLITGAFLHIATTIFFESGTRSHDMNWRKWAIILLGVGLAILTIVPQGAGHAH